MAHPVGNAPTPRAGWRSGLARPWGGLVGGLEAFPLERLGMAALAVGIALRLLAPFLMDLRSDGDTYAAMGQAWALHGRFVMPYGDVTTWVATPAGPSNHYPPAYPFYLGLVFKVFGFGVWQTKLASVAMGLGALGVVYWTTRDLYGRLAASLMGGLVALEPHLLWVTGAGFSENMVLAFFALTMWAILKSLEDDRFILLAGLFAGLAYLSRASVGYFFVIAGAGGFLWRFHYRGWRLFTNVWYLLAIVLFLGIALAWAWRNVALFGFDPQPVTLFGNTLVVNYPLWDTSSYTRFVQRHAFQNAETLRHGLFWKIPFFVAFLAWYVLPLLPESWRATRRIREEHTSALWLSVLLVWITAWGVAGMFWVYEQSSLYWFDNHRYVLIGLLPLGWLLLREADWSRGATRLRYGLLAASLLVACLVVILSPVRFPDIRAAEDLAPFVEPGDEIAVDGNTIKYAFYPYLPHPEQVCVYGWWQARSPPVPACAIGVETTGRAPHFIVSQKTEYDWDAKEWKCKPYDDADARYVLAGMYRQRYWNGADPTSCLWAREDVQAERGVPEWPRA